MTTATPVKSEDATTAPNSAEIVAFPGAFAAKGATFRRLNFAPIPILPPNAHRDDPHGRWRKTASPSVEHGAGKAPGRLIDDYGVPRWALLPEWQSFVEPASEDQVEAWEAMPGANLGICLGQRIVDRNGEVSAVVAIDDDRKSLGVDAHGDDADTIAARLVAYERDPLVAALRRLLGDDVIVKRGRTGSTVLFRVKGAPPPSVDFTGPSGEKVQLLSIGRQTVLPPSVHPCGLSYRYLHKPRSPRAEDLALVEYADVVEVLAAHGFTQGKAVVDGDTDAAREAIETGEACEDLFDRLQNHPGELGSLWRNGNDANGSDRRIELAGRMKAAGFTAVDYADAVMGWEFRYGADGTEHDWDREIARAWARANPIDEPTSAFSVPCDDGDDGDDAEVVPWAEMSFDEVFARLLEMDPVTQWRLLLDRFDWLEIERNKANAGIIAAFGGDAKERKAAVGRLAATHRNAAALEAVRPRVEAAAEAAEPGVVGGFQTIDDPMPEDDLWLIEGVATRVGVTLLAGRSQAGKSTALHHMMGCVTTGRPFFGRAVETVGGCAYLYRSTEGVAETPFKIRALRQSLGDLAEGERFDLIFREVRGPAEIESAIRAAKRFFEDRGTRLVEVGIDSLGAVMGLRDENDNAEAIAAMVALSDIAERQGVHLSVIAHSGKATGGGVRGASGFGDQVSNIIGFEKVTEKVGGQDRDTGRRRVTLDKARLNASGDGADNLLGEFELASVPVAGPKGRTIHAGVVREIAASEHGTDGFAVGSDDEPEAEGAEPTNPTTADLTDMLLAFRDLGPEVERKAFRAATEEHRRQRHEKAEAMRKVKLGRRFKPKAFEPLSDGLFRKRVELARAAGMIAAAESRNAPTVRLHPSHVAVVETSDDGG